MQIAEFDTENFETHNQSKEDEKLLVKFFIRAKQGKRESIAEGRPIYRDVEYIDIKIPGSRNAGICRPATPKDRTRFPKHYAAFKERTDAPSDGTPLSEWPLVTRSLAEELAFSNIKTVEHLASAIDSHISKFMGGLNLKQKAIEWLEIADEEKPYLQMKAELTERDERIAKLEEKLDKLIAASVKTPEPVEAAPSLASDLDTAPEDSKPRRRRQKKVTEDGAIQDNKPDS